MFIFSVCTPKYWVMMSMRHCTDLKVLVHISAIFVPGEFPEVVRLNSCLLSNAMQFLFLLVLA